MTGIFPIKKEDSQSAISDFTEYSMLHPGEFAKIYRLLRKRSEADLQKIQIVL